MQNTHFRPFFVFFGNVWSEDRSSRATLLFTIPRSCLSRLWILLHNDRKSRHRRLNKQLRYAPLFYRIFAISLILDRFFTVLNIFSHFFTKSPRRWRIGKKCEKSPKMSHKTKKMTQNGQNVTFRSKYREQRTNSPRLVENRKKLGVWMRKNGQKCRNRSTNGEVSII